MEISILGVEIHSICVLPSGTHQVRTCTLMHMSYFLPITTHDKINIRRTVPAPCSVTSTLVSSGMWQPTSPSQSEETFPCLTSHSSKPGVPSYTLHLVYLGTNISLSRKPRSAILRDLRTQSSKVSTDCIDHASSGIQVVPSLISVIDLSPYKV